MTSFQDSLNQFLRSLSVP